MSKLDEQKKLLVEYFQQGCKPEGKLTLGLEVEHFVTHAGGEPVTFAEIQNVMRQMQQPQDIPIHIDGLYMGYQTAAYGVSLEPACQVEVSIVPRSSVAEILDIYNRFYLELPSMEEEDGLKTYGAFYVPAVRPEYLEGVPVWDGSFN